MLPGLEPTASRTLRIGAFPARKELSRRQPRRPNVHEVRDRFIRIYILVHRNAIMNDDLKYNAQREPISAKDGNLRILLVEDEPAAAQMLSKGLREEGYAVDLSLDGEDASYRAVVNQYDLIILDVMLPGKDGFLICKELREIPLPVPILMLTARDAVEDRIAGLDLGADDYLTKPFEYREVLARVRALLRRGATSYFDVIEVGDLRIDVKARLVTRSGA